jgi:DNA N-6-adenine-methyltransferase Dam
LAIARTERLTHEEQKLKQLWQKFQSADAERSRCGLEFGKYLYDLRAESSHARRNWLQLLEKQKIPTATAYRWIARYEESIGEREGGFETEDGQQKDADKLAVHFSSASSDWRTPPEIIERTQQALGNIDLDPCSPEIPTVPATHTYTREHDGLRFDWCGKVYMNPPYGREIGVWVEKLTTEYRKGRTKEAIALVPARVDTEWFRMLRDFAVCFVNGRLKFSGNDNSAPFPSAAVYLGTNISTFSDAFAEIGDIWVRWQPD